MKSASSNPNLKYSKAKQIGRNVIDVQEFKSITESEITLQRQVEQYLTHFPDIVTIRIPDHVYKAIFMNPRLSQNVKGLISSYLKRLPDLLLLLKPLDNKYCKALCLEIKTKKGKLTLGQKRFAEKLPVCICRSFEDFQKKLEKFRNE